jgi:hypothetical protein
MVLASGHRLSAECASEPHAGAVLTSLVVKE